MSIIIPASNEALHIGACLRGVFGSNGFATETNAPEGSLERPRGALEIIVVANGCTDQTAAIAAACREDANRRGWTLTVLDLAEGNKRVALNAGDATARGAKRIYLDADVVVSPSLLSQLWDVLDRPEPAYASGEPAIIPGRSRFTRAYGRVWAKVPFVADTVAGCGLFGVNESGRRRWDEFPPIIADDIFVRLCFAPQERMAVSASYDYPLAEGFRNLIRVRRRQDAGVTEVARHFPAMMANEDKPRWGLRRLVRTALSDMPGSLAYLSVSIAVRFPRSRSPQVWSRGR